MKRLGATIAPFLVALLLLAGCTGGGGNDDDGDGLDDEIEYEGWGVTIRLLNGDEKVVLSRSSTNSRDTDRDGLGDTQEYMLGLDASNVDTDGDGLLDGEDLVLDADSSRAESLKEKDIVFREEDEGKLRFLGEEPFLTSGKDQDSDTPYPDGLMDGEEAAGFEMTIMGRTVHVTTDPFSFDSDADFLSDAQELEYGTHPDKFDTDEDGVGDNEDLDPLGNLQLQLIYKTIRMVRDMDAEPLKAADVYIDAFLPGFSPLRSSEIDAQEGQDTNLASISPGKVDVEDGGADATAGQFNVTIDIIANDRDATSSTPIDMTSQTTSAGHLKITLDVRSGRYVIDGVAGSRSGELRTQGADAQFVAEVAVA